MVLSPAPWISGIGSRSWPGGTDLLGLASSRALAGPGAHVARTCLERQGAARETCAAVEALGRRALALPLDPRDAGAIPPAVDSVAKHFGQLDVLVDDARAGFRVMTWADVAQPARSARSRHERRPLG